MSGATKLKTQLLMLLFLLPMAGTAAGQTIYVDADANGLNNGSSWANAYKYLQDGLADANSSAKPVRIRVAQGIYKPDQGAGITPGDRDATFRLKNGVAIKGGYAGFGAPDANARDIGTYETILSGDLDGNDLDVNDPRYLPTEPTRSENSYHVVTGSGTDETAVLDGATIAGGNANGHYYEPNGIGAGMYNDSGSPTLTNCTFSRNSTPYHGGGMFNNFGRPAITNCTFSGNGVHWDGAGIYNVASNPTLVNCTFSNNCGEALYNINNSSPLVTNSTFSDNMETNCTFSTNSSTYGGGMRNSSSRPILINCTFTTNSALNGKALACDSYKQKYQSELQATNCILWDGGNEIWNNDNSVVTITYSDVQGGWPGEGNIDSDPCLADLNNGDYHLKSQAGRWDADEGRWTKDEMTSPCIDRGDPGSPIGHEPFPNGGRINMGAYGGTAEASKSYFGLPLCETIVAGDINGDCNVNYLDQLWPHIGLKVLGHNIVKIQRSIKGLPDQKPCLPLPFFTAPCPDHVLSI